MQSHLILVELTSLGIHSVTISIFPCSESSRKILWCKLHQSCIKHILWSIKYTHLTCLPLICAKYLTHKQTSQGYFHSAISQQYRSLEQYPVSIENNHITHQEQQRAPSLFKVPWLTSCSSHRPGVAKDSRRSAPHKNLSLTSSDAKQTKVTHSLSQYCSCWHITSILLGDVLL